MQVYNDEVYHFGKMGMKWGKRSTYGKNPVMLTAKRRLAADKNTLDKMNNGNHHVSVGLTKKRQEAFDKRDKTKLENRIANNTAKVSKKKSVQQHRDDGAKVVGNVLKLIGANALAVNRNNQAMRLSKIITPD